MKSKLKLSLSFRRVLWFWASLAVFGGARAQVALNPTDWGLQPGDTFRLVVVTYGTTSATGTTIAGYDAFVNSQNLNLVTYNGVALSWQAIGLTPDSNPASDASRYSSQANSTLVYNLNGEQVSNTTAGSQFWRTSGYNQHLAAINYTVNSGGAVASSSSNYAWTGFDYNGAAATARDYDTDGYQVGTVSSTLGTSATYNDVVYDQNYDPAGTVEKTLYAAYGRVPALANGWAYIGASAPLETQYPMYAISELITVTEPVSSTAVPEPASWAAVAGLAALGCGWWRRRKRG